MRAFVPIESRILKRYVQSPVNIHRIFSSFSLTSIILILSLHTASYDPHLASEVAALFDAHQSDSRNYLASMAKYIRTRAKEPQHVHQINHDMDALTATLPPNHAATCFATALKYYRAKYAASDSALLRALSSLIASSTNPVPDGINEKLRPPGR